MRVRSSSDRTAEEISGDGRFHGPQAVVQVRQGNGAARGVLRAMPEVFATGRHANMSGTNRAVGKETTHVVSRACFRATNRKRPPGKTAGRSRTMPLTGGVSGGDGCLCFRGFERSPVLAVLEQTPDGLPRFGGRGRQSGSGSHPCPAMRLRMTDFCAFPVSVRTDRAVDGEAISATTSLMTRLSRSK